MSSKKFAVFWADSAQQDLADIIEYISLDSLQSAEKIFHEIKNYAMKLENFPERGRFVPELHYHNIDNYRELIMTPWRLIYRIDEKKVYVIAFIDGRRNLEDILLKRILNR